MKTAKERQRVKLGKATDAMKSGPHKVKRMARTADSGKYIVSHARRIPAPEVGIETPSAKDDAAITRAAEADPDSGLLTDAEFDALPRVRGPQKAPKKVPVSMRLDPDVLKALKAGGGKWQTRANDILRQSLNLGEKE